MRTIPAASEVPAAPKTATIAPSPEPPCRRQRYERYSVRPGMHSILSCRCCCLGCRHLQFCTCHSVVSQAPCTQPSGYSTFWGVLRVAATKAWLITAVLLLAVL